MVSSIRKAFNEQFSAKKYSSFLNELNDLYPGAIEFRLAETPVFIPKHFTQKMLNACESIIDIITDREFVRLYFNDRNDITILSYYSDFGESETKLKNERIEFLGVEKFTTDIWGRPTDQKY